MDLLEPVRAREQLPQIKDHLTGLPRCRGRLSFVVAIHPGLRDIHAAWAPSFIHRR